MLIMTAQAQAAGRYVLNQSPQTIERYFGRYWTRLTLTGNGVTRVTYTYSPAGLRRVFPKNQINQFSITFVENRAQQISAIITDGLDPKGFTFDRAAAFRLYEYIFGYRPPMWQFLSSRPTGNETIHDDEYCLGDGVVTAFTVGGTDQNVYGSVFTLHYDTRCAPPSTR
jgi:hypothetical protein